ncbi:MAG: PQQ-binding-like beta-propeller repeat protein, partial [Stackebrandtia sp.]
LYAVDESGEPYWDRQMPVDLYGISVAPDTVVADYTDPDDTRERPDDVFEVIDVVTGETLWEDEVSYLAAVFAETVYTFECTRTSDDEFDECELSARDMDTGEARWTEPVRPDATIYTAYHMDHFEAAPADPPYLVLYSDGQAGAVDPADGKALAASVESPHPVNALAAEDVLVSVDDASASPDDGCRATLRGYDVESGKERWETQVSLAVTAKGYGEGQDCDVLWWWARDGDLLAVRDADGVPQTLDLATGEVRAQASEPGTVLATDGEFMLVRDGADGEVGDLTCYDLSSGEVAWTAADPQVELGQLRPRMHGDHVVAASTGYVDDAIVYDRAAGEELMAPPGELAGSGEGWLAAWTTTDDADIVEFSFYALS